MNPHVFLGIVGIALALIGVLSTIRPDVTRRMILKQTSFLGREAQQRLYPMSLMRFIGIGQIVAGVALITQWIIFA